MNIRQMQYAITLSQLRNFSQAAETLKISQPALSKHILSLEKSLGVKLFNRNTTPLTLTPAGEYFIQEAKLLLHKETQLLNTMEHFKSGINGKLTIGITPFRALYLLPNLVRKLQQAYPGVRIVVSEYGSDVLRKGAVESKYDFAIVNLPVDESVLDIIPLEPDTLALVVPIAMADKLPVSDTDSIPEITFDICKDLPFVVESPTQEMRQLYEHLCASASANPNIVCEVVGITTAWAMAHAGVGAALLPLQFVKSRLFDQNLRVFKVVNTSYIRHPCIITRRGQYRSEYAQYAIDLLLNSQTETN